MQIIEEKLIYIRENLIDVYSDEVSFEYTILEESIEDVIDSVRTGIKEMDKSTDKIYEKLSNLGISDIDIRDIIDFTRYKLETEDKVKEYLYKIEYKLPIKDVKWEVKFYTNNSKNSAIYIYLKISKWRVLNDDRMKKINELEHIVSEELKDKIDHKIFMYIKCNKLLKEL